MDFELSEEQKMFKESVRSFFEKECPKDRVREYDDKEEFPHEIWKKMAKLGWMGVVIPEEYGGMGGDIVDAAVISEELGRSFYSVGIYYLVSVCFGSKLITTYGNEEQKQFYLPKINKGEVNFCFGITEPGGGTDVLGALKTFAQLDGDHYIINGQKVFTSGAHFSDYILLVAKTDKNPPKKALGISLLIVDVKTPGIEIRKLKKLGQKPCGTCEVFYHDVRVPKENLLGEEGRGFYHVLSGLNDERITCAALAVGNAQAALEDALQYAKEREAFGKPIGEFQVIQHYLAEMVTEIEMARLLTYRAAWLESLGRPCGVESSMAKLAGSEVAFRAASKGMRILAGYGYMMEYDMQRYYRDSRAMLFAPITNEMVKNFIGESLGLGKSY